MMKKDVIGLSGWIIGLGGLSLVFINPWLALLAVPGIPLIIIGMVMDIKHTYRKVARDFGNRPEK